MRKTFKVLLLVGGGITIIVLVLVANYFTMAWTEPTSPPPAGSGSLTSGGPGSWDCKVEYANGGGVSCSSGYTILIGGCLGADDTTFKYFGGGAPVSNTVYRCAWCDGSSHCIITGHAFVKCCK